MRVHHGKERQLAYSAAWKEAKRWALGAGSEAYLQGKDG